MTSISDERFCDGGVSEKSKNNLKLNQVSIAYFVDLDETNKWSWKATFHDDSYDNQELQNEL